MSQEGIVKRVGKGRDQRGQREREDRTALPRGQEIAHKARTSEQLNERLRDLLIQCPETDPLLLVSAYAPMAGPSVISRLNYPYISLTSDCVQYISALPFRPQGLHEAPDQCAVIACNRGLQCMPLLSVMVGPTRPKKSHSFCILHSGPFIHSMFPLLSSYRKMHFKLHHILNTFRFPQKL